MRKVWIRFFVIINGFFFPTSTSNMMLSKFSISLEDTEMVKTYPSLMPLDVRFSFLSACLGIGTRLTEISTHRDSLSVTFTAGFGGVEKEMPPQENKAIQREPLRPSPGQHEVCFFRGNIRSYSHRKHRISCHVPDSLASTFFHSLRGFLGHLTISSQGAPRAPNTSHQSPRSGSHGIVCNLCGPRLEKLSFDVC